MSALRAAAGLAAVGMLGCAASPDAGTPGPESLASLEGGRYAMGTVLELELYGPDRAALLRARERAFAVADRLERLYSRWDPASDVSRLNASAGTGPVAVDPLVSRLLRRSLDLTARTDGSFDVTVGPLVALWGDAAERDRLPTSGEIAAARARTGPSRVHIDGAGRIALDAGSTLDLGGIAKGFALDRMRPVLREEGVTSALLSFGQSSVWAIGAPPDAPGWRLLARAPDGGFAGVVTLRDRALSVSGSLGQWSRIGGRRFGHVLDPRTGRPITERRQALVVGPDGALTEALSTALLVLGAPRGIAVVEAQPGCEALLLDAEGGRFATGGFDAATAFEPLPSAPDPDPQDGAADVRTRRHAARSLVSGVQRRLSALGRREGR